MKHPGTLKPGMKKRPAVQRRAVSVSSDALVQTTYLSDRALPLVLRPAVDGVNLLAWATDNREWIAAQLLQHGAILFRDFGVRTVDEFEQFIPATSGTPLEYRERSSPRRQVQGHIYTSTDYPADQRIFLHNENSYQQSFPAKVYFFCLTPAQQGGETPLADCRRVWQRIDPRIRDRFVHKQVMYMRNFNQGFGLSWQTVFQTEDQAEVEAYCRQAGLTVEWPDANHLRTRSVRPAVIQHPQTREIVWFNHATFFHISTLEPTIREMLLAEFEEDDLPTNSYYGDGSSIESTVLDDLRAIYERETVSFPWQRGDILLLDNIFTAHGRAEFSGPRQVVVGMSELMSHTPIRNVEEKSDACSTTP